MNTSISLLSSTAARDRRADIRKATRCAVTRAYTRTAAAPAGDRAGVRPEHPSEHSEYVEHMRPREYDERMRLSEYVSATNDASAVRTADSQHVDQSATVAQRLQAIRQQLDAPTHARCTPRRATITATYTVDGESGEVVREAYCVTCGAADISGMHARYGHRTR